MSDEVLLNLAKINNSSIDTVQKIISLFVSFLYDTKKVKSDSYKH